MTRSILLITPSISKPCEPSAGLAKLAWSLRANDIDCRVYDANIDCILGILDGPLAADDTWTRRALAKKKTNIDALRSLDLYSHRDRYKRAVMDTNRILSMAGQPHDIHLSLANCTSTHLSPVRSRDLLQCAENSSDNPFHPIFSRALLNIFDHQKPDIVGISINFMSQALCAFSMIGFIKKHFPDIKIVCGGGLVTSWMKIPAMENPFSGWVDEWICGPGEDRLLELCTGEKVTSGSVTGYDFSDFQLNRYLSPLVVLPYSASRGCYWKKCAFCPEKAENHPYRTDGPSAVVDDLNRCISQTSAGLIHFLDNSLSPRLMRHLSIHPPGIPWYGFARFSKHLADPGFVNRLKASGCSMLKLGVESGDQAVLDSMEKGIDLKLISKALATIHSAGIATYVYLLFGTPKENEVSACKTMDFTSIHASSIDFLNISIFNLPAYSEDAKGLDTGDFYTGDLSLYRSFIHPLGWHRDRVRRFLSKKFKKKAGIRNIISNDPPFFTSNHAPFLCNSLPKTINDGN